jgi:hypothetical protein
LIQWLGWSAASVMSFSGWIFAAALLIVRGDHRMRSVCFFAVVMAMSIYAGHPESSAILLLAVAIFVGVLLVSRALVARQTTLIVRPLGDLIIAGIAGAGLAAPLILPGLQLIDLSARRSNTTLSVLPPHALSYFLFNGFDGLGVGTGTWFGTYAGGAVTDYVGAIALGLVLLALLTRWRRPELQGFVLVALVTIAAVFVPFVASALHRIPLFGSAQLIRAEMPAGFALAMLAGIGLDVLMRRNDSRVVLTKAFGAFGAIALILLVVWLFARGGLTRGELEIRSRSFLWPTIEVALALVALGALFVVGRRSDQPVKTFVTRVVAAVFLIAEAAFLVAAGAPVWTGTNQFFPKTPAVSTLQYDVGSSVVGTGVTSCPSALLIPGTPMLGFLGETNIVYGIHSTVIYDGTVPASDFSAWEHATGQSAGEIENDFFCPVVSTAASARLFGISYVLESPRALGPKGTTFVGRIGNENLYHVPDSAEATLTPLSADNGLPPNDAPGTPIALREPNPSTVQLKTAARSDQVLRIRINDVPGWHATIDGRPLHLEPFAGAMLQARVPPGRHTVVLTYWPKAFSVGLVIAALSVIGLLLGAIISRSRWRST